MKVLSNNTGILAILFSFVTSVLAANYTYNFPITLATSQITHEPFIMVPGPTKDVWASGRVDLIPANTLQTGDTLTLNFNFNQALAATDLSSMMDTNEGLYWAIIGTGVLPTNQVMPYQWQFLNPSGTLFSNLISANGLLRYTTFGVQGVVNSGQTFKALNVTEGTFAFSGLKLTMTIPPIASGWKLDWMRIHFASDQIKIAPLVPTGLVATAVSTSQIDLRWQDNSSTETGFVVGRSLASGGPYTDIGTVSANTTNYSSTNLNADTTYFFVVRSINTTNASANSPEASATTFPVAGPPWQRTFGGDDDDILASVRQTQDGGYLLGGFSRSNASGNKTNSNLGDYDYWLLKLDFTGSNVWQRVFGGNDDDRCSSVKQTDDGGFIAGGYSYSGVSGNKGSVNRGGADFWVARTDGNGTKVWEQTYGGNAFDSLQALEEVSDGFGLGGYSYSGIAGNKTAASFGLNDYWVVRITTNGAVLWDKGFGGSGDDLLRAMKGTSDGGWILSGSSSSGISGNKTSAGYGGNDGWVVRLDSDGNKAWEKSFGGTSADELWSVQQTRDGGYILGGRSSSGISGNKISTNYGSSDGWVIRLDAGGNKVWEKSYGGISSDSIVNVEEKPDGGFMLGGYSFSDISGNKTTTNYGQSDWWVIEVDGVGNILNQQSFGGSSHDELYSLTQMRSGGFLLGGYSMSGISGNKTNANFGLIDMWMVRLGSTYPATLSISRSANGVEVFWDSDFAGWTLQSTPALSPVTWITEAQTPFPSNGYMVVPFTNLADKAFFRLKKN